MSNSSKSTPTHIVCFLVGDENNASPIPAGAAWPDGEDFMIQLEVIPLNGLLVMRPHNRSTEPELH